VDSTTTQLCRVIRITPPRAGSPTQPQSLTDIPTGHFENWFARPVTISFMGCQLCRTRILQSLRDPSTSSHSNDWSRVYWFAFSCVFHDYHWGRGGIMITGHPTTETSQHTSVSFTLSQNGILVLLCVHITPAPRLLTDDDKATHQLGHPGAAHTTAFASHIRVSRQDFKFL
jgi:hypothetical protein